MSAVGQAGGVDPAVVVDRLRVSRGGREVLRDISFRIPRGSVTGLLGPNGSGKTTLLRSIVGVQLTDSGSVTVLGHPAGHPALRRKVGYATQQAAVYLDLTVGECLHYFAAVLGASGADVRRVLADLDLTAHADTLIGRLSGGEGSRASLAVALLGSPQLLVLDEPTVGVDPLLRERLWQLFNRLAAQGVTLLVSSHVMDEAARCERLLLLRDGELLVDDTPEGLRATTGEHDLERAFLRLVTAEVRS